MSKVFDLITAEQIRQNNAIELIASENFVSEDVKKAVGSCLTNKYTEGYPEERTSGNKGRYSATHGERSLTRTITSMFSHTLDQMQIWRLT